MDTRRIEKEKEEEEGNNINTIYSKHDRFFVEIWNSTHFRQENKKNLFV